jgi:hypothetical protein
LLGGIGPHPGIEGRAMTEPMGDVGQYSGIVANAIRDNAIERCARWLEDQYPMYQTVAFEMRRALKTIQRG